MKECQTKCEKHLKFHIPIPERCEFCTPTVKFIVDKLDSMYDEETTI